VLARTSGLVALLPAVVVQGELVSRELEEYCVVPDLYEAFYAIHVKRQHPNPFVRRLLDRTEDEMLAMSVSRKPARRASPSKTPKKPSRGR